MEEPQNETAETVLKEDNANKTYVYFSYGSNMSREKMLTRGRKENIKFEKVYTACLKDWQLTFDIPFMPPVEPMMASVERAEGERTYGVAYELTEENWHLLQSSEGVSTQGGNSKRNIYDVVDVDLECFDEGMSNKPTMRQASTLTSSEQVRYKAPGGWRKNNLFPSFRYMNMVIEGAKQENLPKEYIESLRQIPTARENKFMPAVRVIMLTTTFYFVLSMALQNRAVASPFRVASFQLNIWGEHFGRKEKRTWWDCIGLVVVRLAAIVHYSVHLVPAFVSFLLSPRVRSIYKVYMKTLVLAPRQLALHPKAKDA